MAEKSKRKFPNQNSVKGLILRARLVLRLLRDSRVPWYLKLLPVGATVYLLAPDLLPFNPLDDTIVVGVGFYLFVELCPREVVNEHMQALNGVVPGTWREESQSPSKSPSESGPLSPPKG